MNRNVLLAGLLLVLFVAGGFLLNFTRQRSRSVDFPEGMHWLCQNCQHGFSTSREEFAQWANEHPDQLLPCPKCGKNASAVARKCPLPDCGRYYTQANLVLDGNVVCPLCRNPLP